MNSIRWAALFALFLLTWSVPTMASDVIVVEAERPGQEMTLVITGTDGQESRVVVDAPAAGEQTRVIYDDGTGRETVIVVESRSRPTATVVYTQVAPMVRPVGVVYTQPMVRVVPVYVYGYVGYAARSISSHHHIHSSHRHVSHQRPAQFAHHIHSSHYRHRR